MAWEPSPELRKAMAEHARVMEDYETILPEAELSARDGRKKNAIALVTKFAIDAEPVFGPFDDRLEVALSKLTAWNEEIGDRHAAQLARGVVEYIRYRRARTDQQQIDDMSAKVATSAPLTEAERKAALALVIYQLDRRGPVDFAAASSSAEEDAQKVMRYRRAWYAFASFGHLSGVTVLGIRPVVSAQNKGFWARLGADRPPARPPHKRCLVITIGRHHRDMPLTQYPLLRPFEPDRRVSWGGYANYAEAGNIIVSMTEFNTIALDIRNGKYEVSEILVGGPLA